MRLTSLSLEQFRSYDRCDLAFSGADTHVFVGENGVGKTNLVEAVSFLSTGRSCLKAQPEDTVRWGAEFFRLRSDLVSDAGESSNVEYVWQSSPRRQSALFVRDVKTPLLSFIGTLPTIVFLPQDLDLFTGAPSHRRSFLDALLSQLRPEFAAQRIEFERVLKQRNAIVSRIADGESPQTDLPLWDSRFALSAARLTMLRDDLIGLFNRSLRSTIASLGESEWTDVRMVHDRKTQGTDAASIEAEILKLLAASRERDLAVRGTTVGPHREDWHLEAIGHDIATFASRGQQRAALIALLLGSATLFRDVRGEKPVILLDDVLSELDDRHQEALLSSFRGHQVFITSAHPVPVLGTRTLWTVEDGKVQKVSER